MGDWSDLTSIIGVIGGVLHEAVHYIVSLRAQCFVINTWNSQIHEWSCADSVLFGLVIGIHKHIH